MSRRYDVGLKRQLVAIAEQILGYEFPDSYLVYLKDKSQPPSKDNILIFDNRSDASKWNTRASGKYDFYLDEHGITRAKVSETGGFIRTCKVCGKQFVARDRANPGIYCSAECRVRGVTERITHDFRKEYLSLPPSPDGYLPATTTSITREMCVAGKKLGRQLSRYEVPYFLDRNRKNYYPGNIVVMHINEIRRLGMYAGERGHGEDINDRFNIVMDEDGVHAHLEDKETSVYSCLICANCGKPFKPDFRQILNNENGLPVYCSKSCRAQSTRKEGAYRTLYRPNYEGSKANGSIAEHRFIAQEEILHRPLKPGEIVHHINEIPSDNRPENLMVLDSNTSHNNLHKYDPTDIRITKYPNEEVYNVSRLQRIVEKHTPEYERHCRRCHQSFYVIHQDSQQEFCSLICKQLYIHEQLQQPTSDKCFVCGKDIKDEHNFYHDGKIITTCSKECQFIAKTSFSGDNRRYELYKPNEPGAKKNGNISLQKYVAQKMVLERPLKDGEVVGHIDGRKCNNLPNNLMVFASKYDMGQYAAAIDKSLIKLNQVNGEKVYSVKPLKQIVERDPNWKPNK